MAGKTPFDPGLEAFLEDPPRDPAATGPAPVRIGEGRLDSERFLEASDREALERARRATPLDRSVFRVEGPPRGPHPRPRRWPKALLLLGTLALLALSAWMWAR